MLSDGLIASPIVVGNILSTPVSLIDVFQIGGEEGLHIEVVDVRLRAHSTGDLHREFKVEVGRVGVGFVVEFRSLPGRPFLIDPVALHERRAIPEGLLDESPRSDSVSVN